ncbi:hypothetical protein [Sphingobium xenophagum]|uniref:hypothetical protein n=1 Tax=Sphingobium xenophagum TaxID=121428 RepID=UPI00241CB240|nr:hypothetical protein [Sphingobium xenophagum]
MHHAPFSPVARTVVRQASSLATVTAQLPQALVAAQRPGLAPAGPSPAADRGDHGPARIGARASDRGSRTVRDGGLGLTIEAARYGFELSGWNADWTGAQLFLAGLNHERCASMGAL